MLTMYVTYAISDGDLLSKNLWTPAVWHVMTIQVYFLTQLMVGT